jgi:hypothetical protein
LGSLSSPISGGFHNVEAVIFSTMAWLMIAPARSVESVNVWVQSGLVAPGRRSKQRTATCTWSPDLVSRPVTPTVEANCSFIRVSTSLASASGPVGWLDSCVVSWSIASTGAPLWLSAMRTLLASSLPSSPSLTKSNTTTMALAGRLAGASAAGLVAPAGAVAADCAQARAAPAAMTIHTAAPAATSLSDNEFILFMLFPFRLLHIKPNRAGIEKWRSKRAARVRLDSPVHCDVSREPGISVIPLKNPSHRRTAELWSAVFSAQSVTSAGSIPEAGGRSSLRWWRSCPRCRGGGPR